MTRSLNPVSIVRRSFAWGGRFTRMEFFIGWLVLPVLAAVLMAPSAAVDAMAGEGSMTATIVGWVSALLTLAFLVAGGGGLTVRRLRDMGQHPALALLMLVPCVGTVAWWWLLLAAGTSATTSTAATATAPGYGVASHPPRASTRTSPAVRALILVIGGFGTLMLIGIAAAVAIPMALRSRITASETETIRDLRAMTAARDAEGIDATLLGEKGGYVRVLHKAGRYDFAIVAHPLHAGQTGRRNFCADSSGRICAALDISAEALVERPEGSISPRCAATCRDLQ